MPTRFALFLGLLLACCSTRSCAQDLLQVWALARGGDPVVAAADAARRAQREAVVQARAPLLPQASAGASLAHAGGSAAASGRSSELSASLRQALVDVAQQHQLGATQALALAQDALVRAAEQGLMLRVANAYFGVLGAAATLATVRGNEEALALQVQQADERWRLGLAARVDVEQARAFHATARGNSIAAERALADARDVLAEVTGAAPSALVALRPLQEDLSVSAPQPEPAHAWVEQALAHNPLLQAQRAGLAAATRSIDAARAGHLPTLASSLTLARSHGAGASAADGRSSTTVALTLSVPLFAGDAVQSRVRQALAQREGGEQELEARRRAVAREVQEQWRAVLAGIAQTSAARDAVAAAERSLASTRAGHGLGTQTMNELLQAIQTLAAARNTLISTRHQTVLATLRLRQASGTLTETDLAQVNAWLQ